MPTALERYQTHKSDHYEVKTIHLSSPLLHIGSQVSSLNKFEYVRAGSRVYFPNQDALSQKLYERGGSVLNDYIQRIENNESLDRWLQNVLGENWKKAKTKDNKPVFSHSLPIWALENDTSSVTNPDIRPMIRNGMGQLYIPGSSIKGAIRTAIAHHLLKHQARYRTPIPVSDIEQKIRNSLDTNNHRDSLNNRRNRKFYDDETFMQSLFEQFSLSYQGQPYRARRGPNTDFMRAISVSDSEDLTPKTITLSSGKQRKRNTAILSEVIVSSRFEDWKAKYCASIFTEGVRHVDATFTISVDFEMLSRFSHQSGMEIPFKSVDKLIEICQDFTQDQWQEEAHYWGGILNNRYQGKILDFDTLWEKYYAKKSSPYNFRLGWGSGMFGTTILSLLDEERSPNIRKDLRDACGKPAKDYEAPKSRRTAVNSKGEIAYPLGWAKLKVL